MKFRKTLIAAIAFAGLFAAGATNAHTNEYLDTQIAPHGGQVRMAGIYHFEFVIARDSKADKDTPVTVYVTDHAGTKVSTAGAKGMVTILAGKVKTSINLIPDGENSLKGSGKYVSAPDMKAVVLVTLAGAGAEQARFTPLAKAGVAKTGEHSEHMAH
ncbi:MAG: hypothetical protein KGM99_15655 [Burkholderiales bacterium]|nr:hypothetical protein [Burkholderiales bacterium]